ncbi:MAG: hypothetical protein F4X59_08655 [Holophagales bacterium]|nr:hypothetical protein [Holophagales bacterium]MYC10192.1 hypothetical protein [Holophagales bacterium]
MSSESRYGELVRIDLKSERSEVLERVALASRVGEGGINEATLQELLFDHPECLPIAAIDSAYSNSVPVCRELSVPAGSVDALYVNALGRLTLCEFKLWRNPQARREVIGQILDYAKDLASWNYEDLQRQVSLALGREGSNVLYELVSRRHPDVVEAEFVDNVTRHLRRGEFLLLIVGDGIREGVEEIVDFIGRHSGLHFNLALVEAALYADGANDMIVQPRVLARTEIWRRFVLDDGIVEEGSVDVDDEPEALSDQDEENLRFWTAVLHGFSLADTTVEVPKASTGSTMNLRVPNSGFGGWGLSFVGYLYRSRRTVGCYLTCRKDQTREVRIFDEIVASREDVRREIRPPASTRPDDWKDVELWEGRSGRPRLGFRTRRDLSFLSGNEESPEFLGAVEWMRHRLNRLVSVLNPRLQEMLDDD